MKKNWKKTAFIVFVVALIIFFIAKILVNKIAPDETLQLMERQGQTLDTLLSTASDLAEMNKDLLETQMAQKASLDSMAQVIETNLQDVKRISRQARNGVREMVTEREKHESELQEIYRLSNQFKED